MTEQQIQRVLGDLIAKWQQRASSERLDEQASANAAEQSAYWSGRSDATMDAATDLEEVAEALAQVSEPTVTDVFVARLRDAEAAQVPDISARVRELEIKEAAIRSILALFEDHDGEVDRELVILLLRARADSYRDERALLDRPNGGE